MFYIISIYTDVNKPTQLMKPARIVFLASHRAHWWRKMPKIDFRTFQINPAFFLIWFIFIFYIISIYTDVNKPTQLMKPALFMFLASPRDHWWRKMPKIDFRNFQINPANFLMWFFFTYLYATVIGVSLPAAGSFFR